MNFCIKNKLKEAKQAFEKAQEDLKFWENCAKELQFIQELTHTFVKVYDGDRYYYMYIKSVENQGDPIVCFDGFSLWTENWCDSASKLFEEKERKIVLHKNSKWRFTTFGLLHCEQLTEQQFYDVYNEAKSDFFKSFEKDGKNVVKTDKNTVF